MDLENEQETIEQVVEHVSPEPKEEPKENKELSVRDEIKKARKEVKEKNEVVQHDQEPKASKDKTPKDGAAVSNKEVPQLEAPKSWASPAKAKFSTLDPELQKYVLSREDEVHKTISKQDEDRQFGKTMKDAFTPYMATIAAEGGTPEKAVKQLLNTAYILRTGTPQQKLQLIHQVARDYGVNLGTQTQPVNQELHSLQSQVQQLTSKLQERENYQQQQEQATVQSKIQEFSSNPKNVHFEEVKAHMAALLSGGVAKDLDDAYEQAVWARPDLRSTLMQAQQADVEAKQKAEAKAKYDAARRAGSSVTGAPGKIVDAKADTNLSLREQLRANLRAAQST